MALVLLAAAACTVKEDRIVCPCFLTEDFSRTGQVRPAGEAWISLLEKHGGKVAQLTIHPDMYRDDHSYVSAVPKKEIDVAVVYGCDHYEVTEGSDRLVLYPGCEADSIYAHSAGVDCRKELARDTVILCKQWCTLQIRLEGAEALQPCHFEILGNWNGFSLRDLSAVEGPLSCVPRKMGSGAFEVRLPRQGDDSLSLQVYDTDVYGIPEKLRYEYPLGRLMENRGYDWGRKSLADAIVTIDYAKADVLVEISGWDEGGDNKDITI